MRLSKKSFTISILVFVQMTCCACLLQATAEEGSTEKSKLTFASDKTSQHKQRLFRGEVNSDDVNIRSDSTVTSDIICKASEGETVDVIREVYGWYKIKLPQNASVFINKDFVAVISDEENAESSNEEDTHVSQGQKGKVLKNNVNVRLRTDLSSPILGQVDKDELVRILEDTGEWYRIEPVKNSFGWIHKNFVSESKGKRPPEASGKKIEAAKNTLTVTGKIKPKTITRIATHKLISQEDSKLYLLKSDEVNLASFNSRLVKVFGEVDDPTKTNPIIEVQKLEALD